MFRAIGSNVRFRLWQRGLLGLGIGLLSVAIAAAQFEPPEPPASDDASSNQNSSVNHDRIDRDNSTPDATDQPVPSRASRDDSRGPGTSERSVVDDPDRFREATRATDPAARDDARERQPLSRDSQFDGDSQPSRDRNTRRDEQSRDERIRDSQDSRDSRADRDPRRDDANTRFVPDPRPGHMSGSQWSGDFDSERVRSADIGLWFDRSTADGLVINDIGTGAISRLGFREGDRIYSVNGVRVDSEAAFVRTILDPRWRDQRVNVIIYRHGRPWTVYVQPALLVQEYTTVAYDPLDDWGLVLDDRYDDYVVVWRVLPRSPAFYAGLRAGDVIVNWQGRRLAGREEFVRLAGQGRLSDIALDITRNRQSRRIDVDLSGVQARTSSRTSLRPDFDVEGRAGSAPSLRGQAGARAGEVIEGDVRLPDGAVLPPGPERPGTVRPSSRFEGRIEGPSEGQPPARLDRPDNYGLFPNNVPIPGGVRVERTNRGIFGGRRP